MKILLQKAARPIVTLIFCAAVLTGVWFAVEALYLRYVIAPFESSDSLKRGDVLLALNDILEEVLLEQAAGAEAERLRLEALLQAGGLNREQEDDIQKQIQILSDREEQLNTQVRAAKEEEAVITAGLEMDAAVSPNEAESLSSAAKDRRIQELEAVISILEDRLEMRGTEASGADPGYDEMTNMRGEVERLAAQVDSLNDALQEASLNNQIQQTRIDELNASLTEVSLKLQGSEIENTALRDDLKKTSDRLEVSASALSGLFEAAEVRGVFHLVEGELKIALNPGMEDEVMGQGTFTVHPPGEAETIKTRILIEEKEGKTIFKRYPGQPSPEEGDWF